MVSSPVQLIWNCPLQDDRTMYMYSTCTVEHFKRPLASSLGAWAFGRLAEVFSGFKSQAELRMMTLVTLTQCWAVWACRLYIIGQ